MTRRQSLKILTLVVFCFLSKIHAQAQGCGYDEYRCEGEADPPVCIKLDKICDDNPDCTYEEDETLICEDTEECIGPIKWCDGEKHCSNSDDENECCHGDNEETLECKNEEGKLDPSKFPSKCDQKCVPKCDGTNDNCATLHGKNAVHTTCAEYTDLDEQDCPTTCPNDTDIQCLSSNKNTALPLTCLSPEKKCDGIQNCKTFGEDEQDCPTECPEEVHFQCYENEGKLPLECVAGDKICDFVQGGQLITGHF